MVDSLDSARRLTYLGSILDPERPTVIADIGANPTREGMIYQQFIDTGLGQIYAFEPQPSALEKLFKIKPMNVTILPYAVGDGRVSTLHVCRGAGFTSLLEPNEAFLAHMGRWRASMEVVERLPVATKRLDDITELPPIDLLKIDIQGGELAVFENGRKALSHALAVVSEVAAIALYRGQPLLDDQMRALRDMGFDLHKFLHFQSLVVDGAHRTTRMLRPGRHANQLVDGDAVFLRQLLTPDRLTTEQLKHLALLADGIFASFDLALHALLLLEARGTLTMAQIDGYTRRLPHTRR